MARTDASSGWSRPMSRRLAVGSSASVLLLGSRSGARAQGTAEPSPRRPHPNPPSGRDTSSWFLISRPVDAGYIFNADRFEVYDGRSFALLGGFQAVGTTSAAVTADPAKILLGTATGASIFDLGSGDVTPVAWDVETAVGSVILPDPRTATPTPPRWSFFWDASYSQVLLVDLENATGVDLAELLVKPGATAGYASLRFSPDGSLAAGTVTYNGYYVLDPESPADARLLDGGTVDLVSWAPDFSPDSARVVYVLREAGDSATDGTLVVEDLDSGDVVEIGPIVPNGFAVFPPDSGDELIVFDDSAVTRREIDGGREVWQAETEAVVLALGITGNTLFMGSARRVGGTPAWQTVDLDTGRARALPDLHGLAYYNGSYYLGSQDNPEPAFQLMGPPYGGGVDAVSGPLTAVELAAGDVIPLLDEVSGGDLAFYATSENSGIILYAPEYESRYFLFDLASGERRDFTNDPPSAALYDLAVSADGAAAGFTRWDSSGSGRMGVWLLDVAGGGEPEPLMEGRLWCWAGGTAEKIGSRAIASVSGRIGTPTAYRAV